MTYLEQIDYVYGPYKMSKEKRKFVCVMLKSGRRRTVSYPKFLVEVALGRDLDPVNETVDHIDGDHRNNDWHNMRVVPIRQHVSEDSVRVERVQLVCVWCLNGFYVRLSQVRYKHDLGLAGPFCCKSCSGKYSAELKAGRLVDIQRYYQWNKYAEIKPIRYTITKMGETVADMAARLGILLPAERDIVASLPRYQRPQDNDCLACGKPTCNHMFCSVECREAYLTKECAFCGSVTTNKKYCSTECSGLANRRAKRPSKEKLAELVWKTPTCLLATKLGVSDVAIGKWCRAYGIDKPPRGYWAKKHASNGQSQPPDSNR